MTWNEASDVIIRTWHGWTTSADAEAYARLLDEEVVPGILARRIPGLRGVDVLRRRAGAATDADTADIEFVTIMTFDDWAAVEAFAGPGGTTSVVPPAARRLLRRFDDRSQHYDRLAAHSSPNSLGTR